MIATNEAVGGRLPHLEHEQLLQAQAETLAPARRRCGVLSAILFVTLDTLYGKQRTISKFKVLELVRAGPVPILGTDSLYRITHVHNRTKLARRIYDQVRHPGNSRTTNSGTYSSSKS